MQRNLWLIGLAIAVVSALFALLFQAGPVVIVILSGAALGFGIFLVGVVIRERQFAKEVRQAMEAFAAKNMFSFHGSRRIEEMPAGELSLFGRGDRRRWKNVCEGKVNGRRGFFAVFEYFESDRRGGAWLDFGVAFFPGDLENSTDFLLYPEGVLDRILDLFRGQDLDFEKMDSDAEFSNIYQLRGTDHDAIKRIFNAERRTFFAKHPGWCIEATQGDLVIWREGNLADCFGDRADQSTPTMEAWLAAELAEMIEIAKQLLPPKNTTD